MSKLPASVSEADFTEYVLPYLTHKPNHNRQKVSYHYIFNLILYVLKSGCAWRTVTLKIETVFAWLDLYKRILIRFE